MIFSHQWLVPLTSENVVELFLMMQETNIVPNFAIHSKKKKTGYFFPCCFLMQRREYWPSKMWAQVNVI